MSDLAASRGNKCPIAAGNSYVIFWDKVNDPFTVVDGVATAINASITDVYKYEIVTDTSTFNAVKTSEATGGAGVTTTLELQLSQVDAVTNVELDKMGSCTQCAVIDREGKATAMAIDEGFKTFTATLSHGDGTRIGFKGYTVNAIAETNNLPPILDQSTKDALDALVVAVV